MLSPEVLAQARRLGGTLDGVLDETELDPRVPLPAALIQLFSIRWPEGRRYNADEDGPCYWARRVRFHPPQYCDRVDFGFPDRGDRELFRFAHAGPPGYWILIANDAGIASDPPVFATPTAHASLLGEGLQLSRFLGALTLIVS